MRRRGIVIFAALVLTAAGSLVADTARKYTARLDWVPIGGAERGDVSGTGAVTATLTGSRLVLGGTFEGLPARATAAKLHQGTATGARGRGVVVADLRVASQGTSGTLSGDVVLSLPQVEALAAGRLYVQVYTEKGVQPDHSTLWGWLLSANPQR